MNTRTKRLVAAAAGAAAALAVGGATLTAGDDGDQRVTGGQADEAIAAALAATGGGTANSVELDSENGATWEVEVTKPAGQTVDVRLDAAYRVVVIEGDRESQR
jgi:uncharacterized membrane protein YkoI